LTSACVSSALPRSAAALVRLAPRAYLKYERARAAAATAHTVQQDDSDLLESPVLVPKQARAALRLRGGLAAAC
jgi:hypothetical protein